MHFIIKLLVFSYHFIELTSSFLGDLKIKNGYDYQVLFNRFFKKNQAIDTIDYLVVF